MVAAIAGILMIAAALSASYLAIRLMEWAAHREFPRVLRQLLVLAFGVFVYDLIARALIIVVCRYGCDL